VWKTCLHTEQEGTFSMILKQRQFNNTNKLSKLTSEVTCIIHTFLLLNLSHALRDAIRRRCQLKDIIDNASSKKSREAPRQWCRAGCEK
jgi:hypothetical protein